MASGALPRAGAAIAGLALLPGVASAIPLEPSALADLSALVRATVGAGIVLVVGAGFLTTRNSLVDRSIDASLKSLPSTVFYGLAVHFVFLFAGAYIISQITRVMSGLEVVVYGITGIGLMTAAGLGYTVVGAAITQMAGERRTWLGLAIGTALAAGALLILPFIWSIGAWILIVSVGIGGSAREWFHASHTEVNEREPEA